MKKSSKRVIARVMAILMALSILPTNLLGTANVALAEELSVEVDESLETADVTAEEADAVEGETSNLESEEVEGEALEVVEESADVEGAATVVDVNEEVTEPVADVEEPEAEGTELIAPVLADELVSEPPLADVISPDTEPKDYQFQLYNGSSLNSSSFFTLNSGAGTGDGIAGEYENTSGTKVTLNKKGMKFDGSAKVSFTTTCNFDLILVYTGKSTNVNYTTVILNINKDDSKIGATNDADSPMVSTSIPYVSRRNGLEAGSYSITNGSSGSDNQPILQYIEVVPAEESGAPKAPTATPASGLIKYSTTGTSVALTTETADAEIYYTIQKGEKPDEPTKDNGNNIKDTPITLTGDIGDVWYIKAIATADVDDEENTGKKTLSSKVSEFEYTIYSGEYALTGSKTWEFVDAFFTSNGNSETPKVGDELKNDNGDVIKVTGATVKKNGGLSLGNGASIAIPLEKDVLAVRLTIKLSGTNPNRYVVIGSDKKNRIVYQIKNDASDYYFDDGKEDTDRTYANDKDDLFLRADGFFGDTLVIKGIDGAGGSGESKLDSIVLEEYKDKKLVPVKLKTPVISPESGDLDKSKATITIEYEDDENEIDAVDIYYTLDGSDPKQSGSNAQQYGSSIDLSAYTGTTVTVKAYATKTDSEGKTGYIDSDVATATYTIVDADSQVLTPSISVAAEDVVDGKVKNGAKISITSTENSDENKVDIYYTTDASEDFAGFNAGAETETIKKYTEEITISDAIIDATTKKVTVKAIAVDAEGGITPARTPSGVAREEFTVQSLGTLTATPAGGEVERNTVVYITCPILDEAKKKAEAEGDGETEGEDEDETVKIKDATILYTTGDGEPTETYDPEKGIVIKEDGTVIKAIATHDDYAKSELLTTTAYTIKGSSGNEKSGSAHNFTINGLKSSYYTIPGTLTVGDTTQAAIKHKGYVLTGYVQLDTEKTISFTAEKAGKLELVSRGSVVVKAGNENAVTYDENGTGYSINSVPLTAGTEYTISSVTELYYVEAKYDRTETEFIAQYGAVDPYYTFIGTVDSDTNSKPIDLSGVTVDGRLKLASSTARIAFTVTDERTASIKVYAASTSGSVLSGIALYKVVATGDDEKIGDNVVTNGSNDYGTGNGKTSVPAKLTADNLQGGETYYIQLTEKQGTGIYYIVVSETGGSSSTDTVASVTANPASGDVEVGKTKITLSTSTTGAAIYYTTDGSTPNSSEADQTNSATKSYPNGGIEVTQDMVTTDNKVVIKAYATKAGLTDSSVATFNYTVKQEATVAKPVAKPGSTEFPVEGGSVELECETANAIIYYVTSPTQAGLGTPSADDGTRYTTAIPITEETWLRAIAILDGVSSEVSDDYHYTVLAAGAVAKPHANPGELDGIKEVTAGTTVELTATGADIYYTIADGDDLGDIDENFAAPDVDSLDAAHKYKEAITIDKATIIKAIAVNAEGTSSAVAVYKYKIAQGTVILGKLNMPTADPTSGATIEYGSGVSLKANGADTDSNVYADIYYTTDGTNPTTQSNSGGSVTAAGNAVKNNKLTIKAIAVAEGYENSDVATFEYTVKAPQEGLHVYLEEDKDFVYTGNPITPPVTVMNGADVLTESIDYTVKYSNNIKTTAVSGKKLTITVTGKGKYSGKVTIERNIEQQAIAAVATPSSITVVAGTKVTVPPLYYNGTKLTAKDYKIDTEATPDAKWNKKLDDTEKEVQQYLVLNGANNFCGEYGSGNGVGYLKIPVKIVDNKSQLKKLVVDLPKDKATVEYNGQDQKAEFTVYDKTDKSKTAETALKEGIDYIVSYPASHSSGKVKFTVIGQGDYTGSNVTKTLTIKAPANNPYIHIDKSGMEAVNSTYDFNANGVTIPEDDLVIYRQEEKDGVKGPKDYLKLNKDYKITYGKNKQAGEATYKIAFIGNYKGTKTIGSGNLNDKFTIAKRRLDDTTKAGIDLVAADVIDKGKEAKISTKIYGTVDGALIKASDYTVSYWRKDTTAEVESYVQITNKYKLPDGVDCEVIYARLVGKGTGSGKGNYQSLPSAEDKDDGYLTVPFKLVKQSETKKYDLSKAKITLYTENASYPYNKDSQLKKAQFKGDNTPYTPKVKVTIKVGKEEVDITSLAGEDIVKTDGDVQLDVIDQLIDIKVVNNVNKGKATVIISGKADGQGQFYGSKTATFSIVAQTLTLTDSPKE